MSACKQQPKRQRFRLLITADSETMQYSCTHTKVPNTEYNKKNHCQTHQNKIYSLPLLWYVFECFETILKKRDSVRIPKLECMFMYTASTCQQCIRCQFEELEYRINNQISFFLFLDKRLCPILTQLCIETVT